MAGEVCCGWFAAGLERLWGQCDTSEHHGTAREPVALPGLALLGGAKIGPTWSSYRLNAQRGVSVCSYVKAGNRVRDPDTLSFSWCGAEYSQHWEDLEDLSMAGVWAGEGAAMQVGSCLVQSRRDAGNPDGLECIPPALAFLCAR